MDSISAFSVLIPLLAAISVLEVIAGSCWWPYYFRSGIQIYRREIQGELESKRKLSDITDCSNAGFRFRSVNVQEVVFQEPLLNFSFRTTPLIHGRLIHNGSIFEILGLVNWTPTCVAILIVIFGVVGVVLFGFAGLVMVSLPVMFLTLMVSSFKTRMQRLDDLADEITANLKLISH